MLCREALTLKQFSVNGMRKSAEGIVVWDQARLFRRSRRKQEQQISRTVTRTHEGLNGSRKGSNEESSHSYDETG